MHKSSFLSRQQIDTTIFQYLCGQQSLNQIVQKLIANNCNLTQQNIIKSLLQKLRQFILELQKGLGMAEKIKQVKIYQHDSESIYQQILSNLKQIIPKSTKNQFIQLYKNSRLNSVQVIHQNQYAFVHTDKQLQIYNSIISFAQKYDLFSKSRLQKKDPTESDLPFQDVKKVFPQRDLQLVYRTFKKSSKNVLITYKNLKKLGLNEMREYMNEKEFVHRFDNVLLIGVYQVYKSICRKDNKKFENWLKFKEKKFNNMNFQPFLQQLFRIGIRKDETQQEVIIIGGILQNKMFSEIKPTLQTGNIEQKKQKNNKIFMQQPWKELNQVIQISKPVKKTKKQNR